MNKSILMICLIDVNITSISGPPVSNISTSSNSQHVVNQGVFASASHAALKIKKESDLWEICHQMLPKVPRGYNKVRHYNRYMLQNGSIMVVLKPGIMVYNMVLWYMVLYTLKQVFGGAGKLHTLSIFHQSI